MKKIGIVGLGYVGLPLAYSFDQHGFEVVGFDIVEQKIVDLKNGIDATKEVGPKIKDSGIVFTTDSELLKGVDIVINCVPTPINKQKNPNLIPLQKSSETIGKILQKGQIVVYESTVYPGCTEEICIPILEKNSDLKCIKDFGVGYSPERINPGDKVYTVENIVKIVSGIDEKTLDVLAELYGKIIKAGIHKASSIKVAEAAKVIENTQRDINIALMNELSSIFGKLGINTNDVLEAAGTKWNFLKFHPGLVGGHCIGVDPYWLAYKAAEVGYNPEMILAGRRINDQVAFDVADQVVKMLIQSGRKVKESKVLILGLTFKENVPDFRNSKIADTIGELKKYGLNVFGYDPYDGHLDEHILSELNLDSGEMLSELKGKFDCVILNSFHKEFEEVDVKDYLDDDGVVFDVKGRLDSEEFGFYGCL